ncbi:MAG: hypothetical protein EU517_01540 [Promethearchaeota archaeon]|nr:MAG: hypothetical protein EU517_01540 [Candidatus Lokiarchaeota archaeon]
MSNKGFEPLSSQLGIAGTSYRIQLGLINGRWASRLLKGNKTIDSYVYKEEDIQGDIPNQNMIVGWVLRTVAIPNINPHQVMKTTQALVKQAVEKKKQKRFMAPISETKEVELDEVPESKIKRPQSPGWVKEEGMKSLQEHEDEKREAFRERMKYKHEEEAKKRTETIQTTRELPSIPKTQSQTSNTCPNCGKNLDWKYCPYCGEKL